MISKIKTFSRLFGTVIKVLNKSETTGLFLSFCLSVLNTLLELFSITTIVYLLLVISGQNMSESKYHLYITKFYLKTLNYIFSSFNDFCCFYKTIIKFYLTYIKKTLVKIFKIGLITLFLINLLTKI